MQFAEEQQEGRLDHGAVSVSKASKELFRRAKGFGVVRGVPSRPGRLLRPTVAPLTMRRTVCRVLLGSFQVRKEPKREKVE